jgi:hypothetical protein
MMFKEASDMQLVLYKCQISCYIRKFGFCFKIFSEPFVIANTESEHSCTQVVN